MDVLTLLIADSDETFRHALSQALQDSFYIRTCRTGTQALQMLRSAPVHLLVVDLMLPELDGLRLLEILSREAICPVVLAVVPDLCSDLARRMAQLDIRCVLRKPFSVNLAAAQLMQLRQELQAQDLVQRRTRQLLCRLHILPKYDGYGYLLHALPILAADPRLTITKHLYADTARAFCCDASLVERSIRSAIEVTWKDHRGNAWQALFPSHTSRPTNGQFLQTLALELRKNLE